MQLISYKMNVYLNLSIFVSYTFRLSTISKLIQNSRRAIPTRAWLFFIFYLYTLGTNIAEQIEMFYFNKRLQVRTVRGFRLCELYEPRILSIGTDYPLNPQGAFPRSTLARPRVPKDSSIIQAETGRTQCNITLVKTRR